MSSSEESLVAVARLIKTRGIEGELVAELLTDFPERFEEIENLIGIPPNQSDERISLELEDYWFHDKRVILKFVGFNSIDDAKALIGFELAVPESEAVELEEGEFYDWQLEGCKVETIDHVQIGHVTSVLHTGGVPVLVIVDDSKHEYLVPLAEEICTQIDIENKHILIDPPEGLLEI
jgi:16S rRNA processing protein RimM